MSKDGTAPGAWITSQFMDAEAALRYLVEVIGFTERVVHRGETGAVQHAELLWPTGGGLMMGADRGERRWSGRAGAPGSLSAYLSTPAVADVAQRVADAGWEILRPLADTESYESREVAFLDPEGNAWSVGTYAGHGF